MLIYQEFDSLLGIWWAIVEDVGNFCTYATVENLL